MGSKEKAARELPKMTREYVLTFENFKNFCVDVIRIKYKDARQIPQKLRQQHGIMDDDLEGPFIMNAEQEKLARKAIKELESGKSPQFVILKPRQIGFTTLIAALFLWLEHVYPGFGAMVLAQDDTATITLVEETYKTMIFDRDPTKCLYAVPLKSGWQLGNGSRTLVRTAGTKTVARRIGRSSMNHGVHASEAAFWVAAADTMQAVSNTWAGRSGRKGIIFVESTANGRGGPGGWFYNKYIEAAEGRSTWIAWFVAWFEFESYTVPTTGEQERQVDKWLDLWRIRRSMQYGRLQDCYLTESELDWMVKGVVAREGEEPIKLTLGQILWRRNTIAEACDGNEERFDEEYPSNDSTCFVKSGQAAIAGDARLALARMERQAKYGTKYHVIRRPDWSLSTAYTTENHPFLMKEGAGKHDFWLYCPPIPGHEYVIGGDVSDLADCETALVVLDRNTGEVAAVWSEKQVPHHEAAGLAEALGYLYNGAVIAIERASGGISVLDMLFSVISYPRIYMMRSIVRLRDGSEPVRKPGFFTTGESKPILVSHFKYEVLRGYAKIRCPLFVGQALKYRMDDKNPRKYADRQDSDIFMAGLIAYRVSHEMGEVAPIAIRSQLAPLSLRDEPERFSKVSDYDDDDSLRPSEAAPWEDQWRPTDDLGWDWDVS